jgi:hypothetical protein
MMNNQSAATGDNWRKLEKLFRFKVSVLLQSPVSPVPLGTENWSGETGPLLSPSSNRYRPSPILARSECNHTKANARPRQWPFCRLSPRIGSNIGSSAHSNTSRCVQNQPLDDATAPIVSFGASRRKGLRARALTNLTLSEADARGRARRRLRLERGTMRQDSAVTQQRVARHVRCMLAPGCADASATFWRTP